jgi:hypothetical protein
MAESIEGVLSELEGIIDDARARESPIGYFPALYRSVTRAVQTEIERGSFEDNARMESLLIVFAERYLVAYRCHLSGKPVTASWQAAFGQVDEPFLIVLQHLLLGMNAHISLDLGIATAETAGDREPLSIKSDFMRINRILAGRVEDTQRRITRFFGPLGIVDRLMGSIDERLSIFSIEYARDRAWTQCLELLLSSRTDWPGRIRERDRKVAAFSSRLAHPGRVRVRILLRLVRLLEKGSVSWKINTLSGTAGNRAALS